jgi:hypothetical protein
VSAAAAPVDEAERLADLRALGVLDTPPEERFDRVTRLCQRLFGVPMAFVNLVDADRLFHKSAQGVEHVPSTPRAGSFCAHAILEDDGMVVADAAEDPRFVDSPWVLDDPSIRFYAGVPLESPGGRRVGTLCIADTAPRELTPADRVLLHDLSLWVSKELNLDEELDRAGEVQRALRPGRPLPDPRWDVAGACRPSREIGGDFYDWHLTPDGSVVTLGDVMGKGMPAAIVMASVRAALRAGAGSEELADVMHAAAATLAEDLEATGTFATAVTFRLADDGAVEYVDAGHAHAAVVGGDGTIRALGERGLPLGIDAAERYTAGATRLERGDLLIAHSDGLLELPEGPRTTEEVAAAVRGAATAADAVNRMLGLVRDAALPDDATVVAMRRSL